MKAGHIGLLNSQMRAKSITNLLLFGFLCPDDNLFGLSDTDSNDEDREHPVITARAVQDVVGDLQRPGGPAKGCQLPCSRP